MPLYEYQCEACGQRFEIIQKFSDLPIETCPSCGGPVRKLLSSPAIQFKGTGWYITDYAKKEPAATTQTDNGTATKEKTEKTDQGSSAANGSPAATSSTASASSSPTKD